MTIISDLKRIIDLFDSNLLTEHEVNILLKNIVNNQTDGDIITNDPEPTPSKKWILKQLEIINRSTKSSLIIKSLENPEYCFDNFKCDKGMAVLVSENEQPNVYISSSNTEYERYFRKTFSINGDWYWVYNNWHNTNGYISRELFEKWLINISEISENDNNKNMEGPTPVSLNSLLKIELEPRDENEFKKRLLCVKKATITTYYNDGQVETKTWKAHLFTEKSNVLGNLRSRPQFRSGEWQRRGIIKVLVSVD